MRANLSDVHAVCDELGVGGHVDPEVAGVLDGRG